MITDKAVRNELIVAMFERGESLRKIGAAVGLSQEGVRHVALKLGAQAPQKAIKFPIRNFKRRMWQWLRSCGYEWCWRCKQWLGPDAFAANYKVVCRACGTARRRDQYSRYREARNTYSRDYQRRVPEKRRKWQKNWRDSLPAERLEKMKARINEKRRANYHAKKALSQGS